MSACVRKLRAAMSAMNEAESDADDALILPMATLTTH
jgi:hypothetical protein